MPTFIQKILSYFYPVILQKVFTEYSHEMQVCLYHNQIVLSTDTATYSFGTDYSPYKIPLKYLKKNKWQMPKDFLMLGGGMASAPQIFYKLFYQIPETTIVEKDIEIIKLAKEYLPKHCAEKCNFIYDDAFAFINNNEKKFNCIGVDIFINMVTPKQFLTEEFIEKCFETLNSNGVLIFNTFLSKEENIMFEQKFKSKFTNTKILKYRNSNFYIGTK
jgi:spermidine synthase